MEVARAWPFVNNICLSVETCWIFIISASFFFGTRSLWYSKLFCILDRLPKTDKSLDLRDSRVRFMLVICPSFFLSMCILCVRVIEGLDAGGRIRILEYVFCGSVPRSQRIATRLKYEMLRYHGILLRT